MRIVDETEKFIDSFPSNVKEILSETYPAYEEDMRKIKEVLQGRRKCSLLIAGTGNVW